MINVQIVDDSALVRRLLQELLQVPGIQVSGADRDPLYAMKNMNKQWPDVIILDIEMPRMDGITFLKKLMAERPTPVVICSTLTEKGAEVTMQAMAAGAVDIITKPQMGVKAFLESAQSQLVQAVRGAALARLGDNRASIKGVKRGEGKPSGAAPLPGQPSRSGAREKIIALGTSTGGTQALEAVLTRLPVSVPGIVIVQHMPENFTAAFAQRLNRHCEIQVKEAEHGDRVRPGVAIVAHGGRHMMLRRSASQYRIELKDGPPISRHKPSVDVLFCSVAQAAGADAVGIIMTGMGSDGVRGLDEMRQAGALTLAQDEASCVVYGMPKEALRSQAAMREVALDDIPDLLTRMAAPDRVPVNL